jgi:hypothetical protein
MRGSGTFGYTIRVVAAVAIIWLTQSGVARAQLARTASGANAAAIQATGRVGQAANYQTYMGSYRSWRTRASRHGLP